MDNVHYILEPSLFWIMVVSSQEEAVVAQEVTTPTILMKYNKHMVAKKVPHVIDNKLSQSSYLAVVVEEEQDIQTPLVDQVDPILIMEQEETSTLVEEVVMQHLEVLPMQEVTVVI